MTPERDEPLHDCRRQVRERRRLVYPGINLAVLGGAAVVIIRALLQQPPDARLHYGNAIRFGERIK